MEEVKKDILKICMSKGFLLDRDLLDVFENFKKEDATEIINSLKDLKIQERVITRNLIGKNFEKIKSYFNNSDKKFVVEKFFVNLGYERVEFSSQNSESSEEKSVEEGFVGKKSGSVKLIEAPAFIQRKVCVKDFVNHFKSRYEVIKNILEAKDFDDLSSIRKLSLSRGNYTIIASITDKRITKNKNLFLEVEDLTGKSVVLINQNKKDVFEKAKDLLVDDIVAFRVSGNKDMLFANEVVFPDTALAEKKYSDFDEYVAFSSDLHVGSSMFLEENFLKFVKWLNGEEGDEKQKEMAKKVKYLLLTGDSVDGVGTFPGQDEVLTIKDIKKQYEKVVELLKLIRKDVKIIIAPGQHDAVWVGEPQPIIGEEWAPELSKMENVTLVPNPSLVEIDGGFRILMYHGASMHGIIEEIPWIRLNHGHNNPTVIVKEMLKRRHLAPMHGACDYIPCEEDGLVIRSVPDIVATGDQHRPEVSMYNNILLVASSCWQSITPFEEKVGNNPDPCKVPLFNLKTREMKIMDFSDETSRKTFEERKEEGLLNG